MRRVIFIIAFLLLAGFVSVGFWRLGNGAKESPYITAPVKKGTVTQVVSATGTLQAVVTVLVGSQVSGTIDQLYADFNTKVKAGQTVAQLNQNKFKAAVDKERANVLAAQSNLAKAKVTVADTRRTLGRNQELRKRELVSQSDLDTARTAYDAAVAEVEVITAQVAQAQAALNHAMVDLDNTIIRSPVDGIVISRNVDVGQTVAASLQAPVLFMIANDLSKMEVHTKVDEADVGNVWEGQEVTFTVDAYPTQRFKGKVFQVRNAATNVQNVVSYDAVVRIDNKGLSLKPGMTANVEFLVSEKRDVLRIPNMATRFKPPSEQQDAQAVIRQESRRTGGGRRRTGGASSGSRSGERREGRWVKVYVLKQGEPTPTELRLGITDGSNTEVIEGEIHENDQVIIALSSSAQAESSSGIANPFQPAQPRGLSRFR